MTNYLFKDIFYNFRQFFLTYENRETKFLYEVSFGFRPRQFKKGEVIFEEGDEVTEMYFITSGMVHIGFTHPIKGFIPALNFYKNSYILAYNVLSGSKSEFKYVAGEKTEAFSLERDFLLQVLEKFEEIRSKIFGE